MGSITHMYALHFRAKIKFNCESNLKKKYAKPRFCPFLPRIRRSCKTGSKYESLRGPPDQNIKASDPIIFTVV